LLKISPARRVCPRSRNSSNTYLFISNPFFVLPHQRAVVLRPNDKSCSTLTIGGARIGAVSQRKESRIPEPSEQDRRNAALRQIIADRQRREYTEALDFAVSLFGPGWEPSGRHSLVAHEESERARREGGRAQAHMTVTTATPQGIPDTSLSRTIRRGKCRVGRRPSARCSPNPTQTARSRCAANRFTRTATNCTGRDSSQTISPQPPRNWQPHEKSGSRKPRRSGSRRLRSRPRDLYSPSGSRSKPLSTASRKGAEAVAQTGEPWHRTGWRPLKRQATAARKAKSPACPQRHPCGIPKLSANRTNGAKTKCLAENDSSRKLLVCGYFC
jgi:hypothetical protein